MLKGLGHAAVIDIRDNMTDGGFYCVHHIFRGVGYTGQF